MSDSYTFPADFQWGVATAAYQIEGAATMDGRGLSIWDELSHRAGGTRTGENGDVACDHYHRFEEDVQLMASLGIRNYRFSVSWPRVIPEGTGAVNQKGLDFYSKLVDALLAHDITPHVTLFHWDAPLALQQKYGGWSNRQMATDFADYSSMMVRALGDRVSNWMTINEIPCFTMLGLGVEQRGEHAPGLKVDAMSDVWQAIHYACLGHGLCTQAIRAASPQPCTVSLVDNIAVPVPVTESEPDIRAAQKAFSNAWCNGAIIYPVLTGAFSDTFLAEKEAKGELPKDIQDGDWEIISTPVDAVGINLYSGTYVKAAENEQGFVDVPCGDSYPKLDMPWLQIVPDAIYWGLRHVRECCGFKGDLFISENGCAHADEVTADGEILDMGRILYLRSYLRQVHRAIEEGLPVSGYFQWSFMDNFEWSWGYAKRFGLIFTNYNTMERIPKESARWYSECIRQNRVV